MATGTRTSSRRSPSPSSGAGGGSSRTKAGLEAELGTVRQELSRVDARNDELAAAIRGARYLLAVAAIILLAYAMTISDRRRR